VDGEARARRNSGAPEAVAEVVYSARSLRHIERGLAEHADAAVAAAVIQSAVEHLAAHPLLGRRIEGDIRELIVSYGKTGYVALYRFIVPADAVRILALTHQRAIGFVP
jgi:plasmid stabilization system protein ParE